MTVQSTPPAARQQATLYAIREHHGHLGRTMADHAVTIERSVDQLSSPSARQAVLVEFCTEEVLPHATAEEGTLYRAAEELPSTRLLVRAMQREHTVLQSLVGDLESAHTSGEVVAAAAALNALFHAHLEKENNLLLPALVDADVDLDSLLAGMHDIIGEAAEEQHQCACACGGQDGPAAPDEGAVATDAVLDVRSVPHGRRDEQIFATFGSLPPGGAFVLVNDHNPGPLYFQFAAEHPGQFTWDAIESGPVVWRVRIGRA
jgi:uncharacterized protein (DUF2249 family)